GPLPDDRDGWIVPLKGYLTLIFWISTLVLARSPSTGVSPILSTTSMPSTTSPKIVNLPVSAGWSERQMKNWLPPLSLLEGRSTAATDPRVIAQFTIFGEVVEGMDVDHLAE